MLYFLILVSLICQASRIDDTSERAKVISEHALRLIEARRRVRSLEQVPRADDVIPGNRALVQGKHFSIIDYYE